MLPIPQKKLLYILAIVAFIALISFYEWRFKLLNQHIDELQSQIFINSDQRITSELKNSENPPTTYYPPASAPSNSQSKSGIANNTAMQDLFEAPSNSYDTEDNIDKVKTRYEGILVNYLLLKKCGKTGDYDYQLIFSSLQKDLDLLKAPARLKYDILTAAKGSYDEIYARSTCNEAEIAPTLQRYKTYISSLSQKMGNAK